MQDQHKVLFATGCLFTESNGVFHSVKQTITELKKRGHSLSVIGTRPGNEPKNRADWAADLHVFRRYGPNSMHYAPQVKKWLHNQTKSWDIVSMQGVWLHLYKYVADWCIDNNRKFILSPHGSFNFEAAQISSSKKLLASFTFMRKVFKNVSCYHALTEREYHAIREYGIKSPICVISNGIEIPDFSTADLQKSILPEELRQQRTCLYMGRLVPIKGLDKLINAWASIKVPDDWQLIIAGSGDPHYEKELKEMARSLNCKNLYFIGSVYGDLKSAWLHQASLMVLTSYSEAFPMAVLEGLAYKTPCLLSKECGLPEVARYNSGIETSLDNKDIIQNLEYMLNLPPDSLVTMGENALELVKTRYTWSLVASKLEELYSWLKGAADKPDFVRYD